jgi:hypothetical protein
MPIPTAVFTADEAQALLDLIDRLHDSARAVFVTDEEAAAWEKLRELGKFYLPKNLKET